MRLLNVKQPWAWALVNGWKDVENRNRHLPSTILPGQWVMIVASRSKPTQQAIQKLARLIGVSPHHLPEDYALGAVVGYVQFGGSVDHSDSRFFTGPPAKAWLIQDYCPLDKPIPNVKGSQTLFRRLETHPQWHYIRSHLIQTV